MTRSAPRPTRALLTRHGQTQTNVEERFCGHFETELTRLGARQAEALRDRLANTTIDVAYASDLGRAVATANIVVGERRLEVRTEPGLRELHYGEWEGLKGTVVARRPAWREQHGYMKARDSRWRPPGGETVAEVRERTAATLRRILGRHRGQTVLIVTHGTAINCMLSEVLGAPLESTFSFEVTNCSLSEVIAVGRRPPVVASLNDRAHLEGIESPREK